MFWAKKWECIINVLHFQKIGGEGLNKRGDPTDNLNINQWGDPNKGEGEGKGVWKMFLVKSDYLLSLNMGVPNNYL